MGITIEGPHKSIDMGYGGFAQLRETVAELTAPDISEHYNYLLKNGFLMSKSDFKKYDAKTEELDRKYGGKFTRHFELPVCCGCWSFCFGRYLQEHLRYCL